MQSTVMQQYVVRLSIHDVQVWFSHRLEYFKNNFIAEYLRYLLTLSPTSVIWSNGDTPKVGWNRGGFISTSLKWCKISPRLL